jgi:hypothetical protein
VLRVWKKGGVVVVWLRGVPGGKLSQIFVTDEGTVPSKISQLQVESRARLHACFVFSAFPELQKKLTKKRNCSVKEVL